MAETANDLLDSHLDFLLRDFNENDNSDAIPCSQSTSDKHNEDEAPVIPCSQKSNVVSISPLTQSHCGMSDVPDHDEKKHLEGLPKDDMSSADLYDIIHKNPAEGLTKRQIDIDSEVPVCLKMRKIECSSQSVIGVLNLKEKDGPSMSCSWPGCIKWRTLTEDSLKSDHPGSSLELEEAMQFSNIIHSSHCKKQPQITFSPQTIIDKMKFPYVSNGSTELFFHSDLTKEQHNDNSAALHLSQAQGNQNHDSELENDAKSFSLPLDSSQDVSLATEHECPLKNIEPENPAILFSQPVSLHSAKEANGVIDTIHGQAEDKDFPIRNQQDELNLSLESESNTFVTQLEPSPEKLSNTSPCQESFDSESEVYLFEKQPEPETGQEYLKASDTQVPKRISNLVQNTEYQFKQHIQSDQPACHHYKDPTDKQVHELHFNSVTMEEQEKSQSINPQIEAPLNPDHPEPTDNIEQSQGPTFEKQDELVNVTEELINTGEQQQSYVNCQSLQRQSESSNGPKQQEPLDTILDRDEELSIKHSQDDPFPQQKQVLKSNSEKEYSLDSLESNLIQSNSHTPLIETIPRPQLDAKPSDKQRNHLLKNEEMKAPIINAYLTKSSIFNNPLIENVAKKDSLVFSLKSNDSNKKSCQASSDFQENAVQKISKHFKYVETNAQVHHTLESEVNYQHFLDLQNRPVDEIAVEHRRTKLVLTKETQEVSKTQNKLAAIAFDEHNLQSSDSSHQTCRIITSDKFSEVLLSAPPISAHNDNNTSDLQAVQEVPVSNRYGHVQILSAEEHQPTFTQSKNSKKMPCNVDVEIYICSRKTHGSSLMQQSERDHTTANCTQNWPSATECSLFMPQRQVPQQLQYATTKVTFDHQKTEDCSNNTVSQEQAGKGQLAIELIWKQNGMEDRIATEILSSDPHIPKGHGVLKLAEADNSQLFGQEDKDKNMAQHKTIGRSEQSTCPEPQDHIVPEKCISVGDEWKEMSLYSEGLRGIYKALFQGPTLAISV